MFNLDDICDLLEKPPNTPPAELLEECRTRLAKAEERFRTTQSKQSKIGIKRQIDQYRASLALVQQRIDSQKAASLLGDLEAAIANRRTSLIEVLHQKLVRLPKGSFTEEQRDQLSLLEANARDSGSSLRPIDFSVSQEETDTAEAERAAAKVLADKIAADKAAADKTARDQAEADRLAADKAAADRAAATRLQAERAAAKQAEAERLAIQRAEEERAAAELAAVQSGALTIPKQFLGSVQPGGRLSLVPVDAPASRTIHLISREEFKLGRAAPEVDFLTWFLPRSTENDTKTRYLSKVHVVGRVEDGKPCFRDNSGNGSFLDNQPLSQIGWEPVKKRGVLRLGAEYSLDVLPVAAASDKELNILNLASWAGPSGRPTRARGCLLFFPVAGGPAKHDSLWLFTDASFGSGPANPVVIDNAGLAEVQGRFHFYRGCFWLENVAGGCAVLVDDTPLKPRQMAPLVNGNTLRLGPASFRVEVAA